MNQLTIFAFVTFCAVVLAIQALYWTMAERKRSRAAINRRLVLEQESGNARDAFEALKRERGLSNLEGGRFTRLNEFLVQTGLRLDERWLAAGAFGLSVLYFLLFAIAFGFGIGAIVLSILSSGLSLIGAALYIRSKRIRRFAEQLPDAIDVVVRGVKAGYPFTVALGLVAREMPDPIGSEIGLASDEIAFGADIRTALDNLHRRVGESELLYLTMAIKVQTETGGNLAEVLGRLAKLMRDRAMLALKVRSITAEGRMSAVILSVFPFIIFGVVSFLRHDYYSGVSDNPIFFPSVVMGFFLLIVGNFIMYKMVNFKV